jgi:CRISPR/Cas system CSM-associated protein Csm3 (group 7 of RAMP superfamily)
MKLADLRSDTTRYELTAVIDTALCIGAGGSSGSLADKPIVRNAEGRLIIPGSHLKGRLRHECEKIVRVLTPHQPDNLPSIISIFGSPALPAHLLVDDLICIAEPESLPSEVIRPGVSLNRRRRTAEDQKLYYLETSPANMKLAFTGEIHLINPPLYAPALIVAGLNHIRALGGSKSAGLGWLAWNLSPALVSAAQDKAAWRMLGGLST